MSAAELIEQLKSLPPKEREAFVRLFQKLQTPNAPMGRNGEEAPGSGCGNWPDFGTRLTRIYGSKVAADSAAVLSYARGNW